MSVVKDLHDVLGLVKENFHSIGFADRVDSIAGLIGAGEYELAYIFLCSNIHEFDMPIPPQAYALLAKIWPDICDDVQKMEGSDWHYLDYLGNKAGFPSEKDVLVSTKNKSLKEKKSKNDVSDKQNQRVYPWNAEPIGVSEPGNIWPNENWKLTRQTTSIFDHLIQLGVQIYSVREGTDYTFMVPHRLFAEQYTEVESLLDTIAQEVHSDVQYIDWHPHGHKLRIYLPINPQG
jgi:hypothetical protein